jgi:hypothetical protein
MIDLYVYYKVREGAADALAPRVLLLLQDIAARHGVHGQLKRRPDARDGLQTWMEVYPGVDQGFALLLAQAVTSSGLESELAGPRHAEIFMDITPCA